MLLLQQKRRIFLSAKKINLLTTPASTCPVSSETVAWQCAGVLEHYCPLLGLIWLPEWFERHTPSLSTRMTILINVIISGKGSYSFESNVNNYNNTCSASNQIWGQSPIIEHWQLHQLIVKICHLAAEFRMLTTIKILWFELIFYHNRLNSATQCRSSIQKPSNPFWSRSPNR